MQENIPHKELGFIDVVKIVCKKFWIVVIAALVGALVGALLGYKKVESETYYSTTNYKISVSSVLYVNGVAQDDKPSGNNYLYKEEHLTMLIDDLSSDVFIKDKIMASLEVFPSYNPNANDDEADAYYTALQYVKGCISYSYDILKNPNSISVSVKVTDTLAHSVGVPDSKEFAKDLLDQVKESVPEYIKKNMIKPATENYSFKEDGTPVSTRVYSTECEETSLSRIRAVGAEQVESSSVKYAILAGFLAAVVAAIVIVAIDYANPRTKSSETEVKAETKTEEATEE